MGWLDLFSWVLDLKFLQYNNSESGVLNCIWIVDGLGLSFGSFFFVAFNFIDWNIRLESLSLS